MRLCLFSRYRKKIAVQNLRALDESQPREVGTINLGYRPLNEGDFQSPFQLNHISPRPFMKTEQASYAIKDYAEKIHFYYKTNVRPTQNASQPRPLPEARFSLRNLLLAARAVKPKRLPGKPRRRTTKEVDELRLGGAWWKKAELHRARTIWYHHQEERWRKKIENVMYTERTHPVKSCTKTENLAFKRHNVHDLCTQVARGR